MSKLLYYRVQFVALHQSNPGYSSSNYLDIAGVTTNTLKYNAEFSYFENGKKDAGLDYSEFSITHATFVRPSDFGSRGVYQREASYSGDWKDSTYSQWSLVSVPDNFVIPSELNGTSSGNGILPELFITPFASPFGVELYHNAREFLYNYVVSKLGYAGKILDIVNTNLGLFHTLKEHMDVQFGLINQALNGQIDAQTLMELSDNASRKLISDLVDSIPDEDPVKKAVGEAIRELVTTYRVPSDGVSHEVNFSSEGTSGGGFYDAVRLYSVGSPSNDGLYDWETGGDVVLAGLGDDRVQAFGGGGDILIGGEGVDTIDFSGAAYGQTVYLTMGTANESSGSATSRVLGFENFVGSRERDVVFGTDGVNILIGGDGADSLTGYNGDDILVGGDGADFLDGTAGSDTARYTATYWNGFSHSGHAVYLAEPTKNSGSAKGDTYSGVENVEGSDLADALSGDASANILIGGGGDDYLDGLAGQDKLIGGAGRDSLYGRAGNDELQGGTEVDYLGGGDGNDVLFGGSGDDTIQGEDGDDRGNGDAGADSIYAGNGNDSFSGAEGADYLGGGAGRDALNGDAGNDTIQGGADNDTIDGGSGFDILFGDDGADVVRGGADGDNLFGLAGTDRVEGQGGWDQLYGGGDADVFAFGPGFGVDTIGDFEDGATGPQDRIEFSKSIFADFQTMIRAASDFNSSIVFISAGQSGVFILNAQVANLGADDFSFV